MKGSVKHAHKINTRTMLISTAIIISAIVI
jgi:hypothetical protein